MANIYVLEASFSMVDGITKKLNAIGKTGTAVSNRFKADIASTQKQLEGLAKGIQKYGKYVVGAAVTAASLFAKNSVKDAMDFSTAMARIATTADTAAMPLKKIEEGLYGISKATGIGLTELATATYDAMSSGIKTADSIAFIESVSKTSIAGFTDMSTAVKGLSAVLNAYQIDASQVTGISDQMFLAMDIGSASFDEMASSIGRVLPVASSLQVKTGELFAAVATLTLPGSNGAEAITGISGALNNVLKVGSGAAKLASSLKLDFSASALRQKGLMGFLDDVYAKTGGDSDMLAQLFGGKNGMNAVMTLIGPLRDTFHDAVGRMKTEAGALDNALSKIFDTPEQRWKLALNSLKLAGTKLGDSLMPVVEKIIEKINEFADCLLTVDFKQFTESLEKGFDRAVDFIKKLWDMRDTIKTIIGLWVAYKAITVTALVVGPIWGVIKAVMGLTEAQGALNVATQGTAAAQLGLNAAAGAFPINAILAGIFAIIELSKAIDRAGVAADKALYHYDVLGDITEDQERRARELAMLTPNGTYLDALEKIRNEDYRNKRRDEFYNKQNEAKSLLAHEQQKSIIEQVSEIIVKTAKNEPIVRSQGGVDRSDMYWRPSTGMWEQMSPPVIPQTPVIPPTSNTYSESVSRETVDINVTAAPGTRATTNRQGTSSNISLIHTGSN